MSTERKKMGRPAGQEYPHLLHIRISDDMRDALERARLARLDQPTVTVLIREMLAKGLEQVPATPAPVPQEVPAVLEPKKSGVFSAIARKG